MREKGKQEWSSEEDRDRAPEEAPPTNAPIDEDGLARRAGEIIARAASHASDAVLHRGKWRAAFMVRHNECPHPRASYRRRPIRYGDIRKVVPV
jgi:hypothetical protein